jgi:hypothetical protein
MSSYIREPADPQPRLCVAYRHQYAFRLHADGFDFWCVHCGRSSRVSYDLGQLALFGLAAISVPSSLAPEARS